MSNKPEFRFSRMINTDGIKMNIMFNGKSTEHNFPDAMAFEMNPSSILPLELTEFTKEFYKAVEDFRDKDKEDAESVWEAR